MLLTKHHQKARLGPRYARCESPTLRQFKIANLGVFSCLLVDVDARRKKKTPILAILNLADCQILADLHKKTRLVSHFVRCEYPTLRHSN